MHLGDLLSGKEFGVCHGFKVCTGTRYLDGFIEDNESKRDWLKYRKSKWETNICAINETTGKYPQNIYSAVVGVIQPGWIILQHVTKDTEHAFTVVEKLLQETFLPHLFFRK